MTTERKPFIAVNLTPAMSGYFATLYDWSWMEGGTNIHGETFEGVWFPEPYETAMGRHTTPEAANAEGEAWATDRGLEFFPATPEKIVEAEKRAASFKARALRTAELRREGKSFTEARAIALAEQGEG